MAEDKKLAIDNDGMVEIDGFEDKRVGSDYELYRPQDGRSDRISVLPNMILLTKDNVEKLKPKIEAAQGFVLKREEEVDGQKKEVKYFVGHVLRGAFVHFTDKGPVRCLGKGKICCQLAPRESNLQVPIPIIRYTTNKDGDLMDAANPTWEVMIWALNEAVYGSLRGIEKEFPLVTHDLKVKGKKQGKYVRIENLTAAADCAWRKKPETERDNLIMLASTLYRDKCPRWMGRKLSEEQMREFFGQAPSKPEAADASSGVNVDDLVSGL